MDVVVERAEKLRPEKSVEAAVLENLFEAVAAVHWIFLSIVRMQPSVQ